MVGDLLNGWFNPLSSSDLSHCYLVLDIKRLLDYPFCRFEACNVRFIPLHYNSSPGFISPTLEAQQ